MEFSWFHLIPGLEKYPDHVLTEVFCTLLLVGLSLTAYFVAGDPKSALIPSQKFSLRGLFEVVVEMITGLVDSTMGPGTEKFVPVIGGLFIYILANNLLGLFPGFSPATDNMNTTFACGLLVFVLYNVLGIREHGISYLKHFLGPVWWLAPLMVILEVISHIVRPISLGLRLRGNMTGDHKVLSIFIDMVPIGVPMIFYVLGIFVCVVQALVFSLLSMVYISMATAHDH